MFIIKRVLCALLLLSLSVGLMIGYASLADNPFIYGEASAQGKPFVGVYIYDAQVHSTSGASSVSLDFVKPTNLMTVVNTWTTTQSVTYKITFHNNSEVTYWYLGTAFDKDYESNSLIEQGDISIMTKDHPNDTVATFNNEDWIPPGTYRDVYITFTYGAGASGYILNLVNFKFGVKMDSVHDKFLTVLNDNLPGGSYELLDNAFEKKYKEAGSNVIANIGDEKALFDTLFGENPTVNVDGVERPVTIMVERENVDGRATGDSYSGGSGCEYTVYITVDPINSPTGKAIVYAVSYSQGGAAGDGEWYQLGELYEGTANKIDYDSKTPGVQGAVDVNDWIASPNRYELANGIVYLVGQEQGDQYDKLKTIKELMSTFDQDIFNDIDNSQILKKVYDIVYNSNNAGKPGYHGLRDAFIAAEPFYNVMNQGQEIKVKREATRAEIIPFIEAIQEAYEYYNEVN